MTRGKINNLCLKQCPQQGEVRLRNEKKKSEDGDGVKDE
jgi:hypothetical protein